MVGAGKPVPCGHGRTAIRMQSGRGGGRGDDGVSNSITDDRLQESKVLPPLWPNRRSTTTHAPVSGWRKPVAQGATATDSSRIRNEPAGRGEGLCLNHASPATLLITANHRTRPECHAGLDRIAADTPGTALRNEEEAAGRDHVDPTPRPRNIRDFLLFPILQVEGGGVRGAIVEAARRG